jgi:hypothetical protein
MNGKRARRIRPRRLVLQVVNHHSIHQQLCDPLELSPGHLTALRFLEGFLGRRDAIGQKARPALRDSLSHPARNAGAARRRKLRLPLSGPTVAMSLPNVPRHSVRPTTLAFSCAVPSAARATSASTSELYRAGLSVRFRGDNTSGARGASNAAVGWAPLMPDELQ